MVIHIDNVKISFRFIKKKGFQHDLDSTIEDVNGRRGYVIFYLHDDVNDICVKPTINLIVYKC